MGPLGAALLLLAVVAGERTRELQVSEGAPAGSRVGFLGDASAAPPFLVVPVPGSGVADLTVDRATGEVRTNRPLDRETHPTYDLVAIPRSGDSIRVVVRVLDENDNAPAFPAPGMRVEFPENTPRDFKRTLLPARDPDLGAFSTQRYDIISGNADGAFRLSSHRERDGVLYLDLQISGCLDRETTPEYSLVIEALDGGNPPLRGTMTVNITVQDVNDNQPVFDQSRYFATVAENATLGTSVLRVSATDIDLGPNGEVEYSINRRQSDRDAMFRIDSSTGEIAVNRPLDFEAKEVHELVVVARDKGDQPLETTAFVSIRVTDVNDNQPTINVIFLSDDATPKISETAQPGEFVARISVHDPDSKTEYADVNVTLEGGEGHFGLTTQDNIIYLVIVALPIDREDKSNYTLSVIATDTGTPPLHASKVIHLRVTDVNDNAPEFAQSVYHANVLEVADPGTSVLRVTAVDRDEGENSVIRYSLLEQSRPWFSIEAASGLITTAAHIDCETEPVPRLVVLATDSGSPPLSSSATVLVTVHDVNDNEPIFDQSFFNITIKEDESPGKCFMKVTARDPDCGVNAMVNYTLGEARQGEFVVQSQTGQLCLQNPLDYEKRHLYEFPLIATDRGGLSTTAMVKITVVDVNDNRPVFYPREYEVSLREGERGHVATVAASDADSGRFGAITYRIVTGPDASLFRVHPDSGRIFLSGVPERGRTYRVNVSASDGGGLRALRDAEVTLTMLDPLQRPPHFAKSSYSFSVREDALPSTLVGTVLADPPGSSGEVRYSISSGDPEGCFVIDESTGAIRTSCRLDHETRPSFLLNVRAATKAADTFSQVHITVEDVNDNAPEFGWSKVKISVGESAEVGAAIYSAQATDADSGENGRVSYRLAGGQGFKVDPATGHLSLTAPLDFESAQRHSLVITASDHGRPSLSANLSLLVEVQDVNDNPPVFERAEYSVVVSESLPLNSQVVQVTAVDLDTGNNARLTYRTVGDWSEFGVFPSSGWIYLRGPLDREIRSEYRLRVSAQDNGWPPASATTIVVVTIADANDNAPSFAQPHGYVFAVSENLPRGASVGKVEATDPDLAGNAAVRFSIVPANSSFNINPITGEVTTGRMLDREERAEYEVAVEARDGGSPPRSTRVPLRVTVTDVNDNAPLIVDPREDVVSVREEQPPGTEVVRVRAIDPDLGPNATLTYSLIKGREVEGWGAFSIDPVSGVVRTRAVLEHAERPVYRLTVAAADSGTPPKHSARTLRVEVLAAGDRRPTFSSSSLHLTVSEDAAVGSAVGVVGGAGPAKRVSLSPPGTFALDHASGSLVVASGLDRETASSYRLEVRSLDTSTANPQSSAVVVTVEVTDVNDNPPIWETESVEVDVAEDAAIGTTVWVGTARDADAGPNGEVRYSLDGCRPQNAFTADPLTGALVVSSTLDREKISEYIAILRASDQAEPTTSLHSTLTVKISVRDVNDNAPTFTSPLTIYSKAGLGRLTRLTAVDPDSGDNGRISFSVSSDAVAVDPESGELSAIRDLTPESRLSINVTAADHGRPSKKSIHPMTLIVLSGEESPPRFLRPRYAANVSEDAAVGFFVVTVAAKSQSGKVTYSLGGGVSAFTIDHSSGVVRVAAPLDREAVDTHAVPVFARSGALTAAAELRVTVMDANDHAPALSCRSIVIPENREAVLRRFAAFDPDRGPNGRVSYSITGGNVGNKFSMDGTRGELSCQALDREARAHYQLEISAEDGGGRRSSCVLSVIVEDANDNDPAFEESKYSAEVIESAQPGTSILQVKAKDPDLGPNGKILFSLANETNSLFTIDNKTGLIYTIGNFDREKQSTYDFVVVATDNGRYTARSARVPVSVTVTDVNDNRPSFQEFPFIGNISSTARPGDEVVRVIATDPDLAANGDIVYRLEGEGSERFRINPRTGAVSLAASFPPGEQRFRLSVVASDKGNPPLAASGLIEIAVGNVPPPLRFRDSVYDVSLTENPPANYPVVQVSAVRTDGRRQKITYSIGAGNDDGSFGIDPSSGNVFVLNPEALDFETSPSVSLVVVASAESSPGNTIYGYATVNIKLTDENDNSPKFTQSLYYASVWEGNNKGNFVLQISAVDMDQGKNSHILYHIVDGNHDNAFVIEPPFSGIVKTNIVLDREIRDAYQLTVIATDEGVPQLTGTATVRIKIVDVNDNRPTFPPHSAITVNEGQAVGSVLTTVTANDVDTNPPLMYSFADPDDNFSIDKFSGKVILCQSLDYEAIKEYQLNITASDSVHTAHTVLTIEITDDNDNPPQFQQISYYTTLSVTDLLDPSQVILTVSATDKDTGKNSEIRYSLAGKFSAGFSIDERSGELTVNRSVVASLVTDDIAVIDLGVKATDLGQPPLSSMTSVRVRLEDMNTKKTIFANREYRASVKENVKVGSTIVRLAPSDTSIELLMSSKFFIMAGNDDGNFQVLSPYGDVIIVKPLDREHVDTYTLSIVHGLDNSTKVNVFITVNDANDCRPNFQPIENIIMLSESVAIGHTVVTLKATDEDLPPNSDIRYEIISGNDRNLFNLDPENGKLTVNGSLDYDKGYNSVLLTVSATDLPLEPDSPLTTYAHFRIQLSDENDNIPKFPVAEYLEFVGENELVGATVFIAHATDMDLGAYGKVNYSIESAAASGYTDVEDSWKMFKVDPKTGLVSTNAVFDYETRSRYEFTLTATDSGGLTSKVRVRVEIDSKDEFHPQFTERTYKFSLNQYDVPVGFVVGHVVATDRDKGPDGRIMYQLSNQHPYFKVNRTTGAILLKKKLDLNFEASQDISFVVTASSGRQGSLSNMTVVEIALDPLASRDTNLVNGKDNTALAASTGSVADWAVGLLITLILIILSFGAVFLFLHVRNRRNKNLNKPGLGGSSNDYVDPGAFDTIPIRGGVSGAQYGPPKYEEIPTYRNAKSSAPGGGAAGSAGTASQLDPSGSSGRGSAEDGEDVEDEEIRMINESVQRELRPADDELSDASQEYLARLGVAERKADARRRDSAAKETPGDIPLEGLFADDAADEVDLRSLIYSKLAEQAGSERGGDEPRVVGLRGFAGPTVGSPLGSLIAADDVAGAYNWDYLLDWGAQYQPIAHVFSEIARLKEDAGSVKSAASGTSSGKGKAKPPPLLTSVAPRSIAAPVLSARSHPKSHPHTRSPPSSTATPLSSSPAVTPRIPSSHPLRQPRTAETELRL